MSPSSEPAVARRVDGFVSYARADVARVVPVIAAMQGQGRTVWLDSVDIAPGSFWREELRRAIETADAVICFVSPRWAASNECRAELDLAISLGKRLVPIVLDPVDINAIPGELRAVQWIDAAHRDPADVAAAAAAAIDLDADRVRDHTFWLTQAIRWESAGRHTSALARGRSLRAAEAWLQRSGRDPEPTPLQVAFITASRRAERRRGRVQLSLALSAVVVAATLAIIAVLQRNTAVRERDTARSRALAVASADQLGRDPELSLLLARAAWQSAHTVEALSSMRAAVAASLVRLTVHGTSTVSGTMGFGRVVVTADTAGWVTAWDTSTGRRTDRVRLGGRLAHLYRDRVGQAAVALLRGRVAELVRVDASGHLSLGTRLTGVSAAGVSGNGQVVVIGHTDGTVLRSVKGGAFERLLTVASDETPDSVAVSDSGTVTAVGTGLRNYQWTLPVPGITEGRLYLDTGRGRKLAGTAATPIDRVALDDKGTTVLSAAADGSGSVATVRTGRRLLTLRDSFLTDLDPTGRYAVSSTIEGATELGSVTTGRWSRLSARSAPLADLRFSADGTRVAGASIDGPGYVWATGNRRLVASLLGSSGSTASIFVETGDAEVVSGHVNGDAHVWALPPDPVVVRFGSADANATAGIGVNSVSVSPDGRYIATSTDGGAVQTWGVDGKPRCLGQGQLFSETHCPITLAVGARIGSAIGLDALARFSPDGRHLAVQASDGGIWVFSTTRIPRVLWHSASVDTKAAGGILAYSPDGQRLLAQHGTDAPRVLDAASGRTTATLAGAARTTTVGAWVGDDRIVIGDAQGGVDSYSSSGGDRRRLTRLGDAVLGAAASPDGRTVAVSAGSTVEVLDAATGARIRTLSGHTQNVTALAYSSSGNYLLSGSSDGTARLWNVGTGTTLTRLDEPGSQIRAVAYDSAARTVIAGGRDSALYLSRCDVCISPSALADIAAQHTTRTLTDAERAEFGVGSLLK